jgi:hypothetical protein
MRGVKPERTKRVRFIRGEEYCCPWSDFRKSEIAGLKGFKVTMGNSLGGPHGFFRMRLGAPKCFLSNANLGKYTLRLNDVFFWMFLP